MIKVNLLPVKKKKKAKPLPTFLLSAILLVLVVGAVMAYLVFFFNSKLESRRLQVAENEQKIAELKKKIASVEDYEKRNAEFMKNKEIIEQLSKNKTVPVKVIDELSALLPPGVWLSSLNLNGLDVNLGCVGFTNTDVVNYVNNLKGSKLFTDVYLQESVQTSISNVSAYNFRILFKVKG